MFTALAHWKMHLADYFSWLRDENWHKRKQEEMMARYPALHAAHETLVEVHTFEGPFIGRIYKATLYNERDGYLIEMFEPAQTELERGLDDRRLATELLEGHGYPGMEVYGSLEEARAALPEALKQALEQQRNTYTFTDKNGVTHTWLQYTYRDDSTSAVKQRRSIE